MDIKKNRWKPILKNRVSHPNRIRVTASKECSAKLNYDGNVFFARDQEIVRAVSADIFYYGTLADSFTSIILKILNPPPGSIILNFWTDFASI